MPTPVIETIGATSSPVTPDFSTPAAWSAAIVSDLVAGDVNYIGECLDQGEFTNTGGASVVAISGHTTDATRNIILRCASGAGFADKAGVRTTALYYNASNGVAFRTSGNAIFTVDVSFQQYVRVEGLQVNYGGNYGQQAVLAGANVVVDGCIIKSSGSPVVQGAFSGTIFSNCFIESTGGNGGRRGNYYGCTFVRTGSTADNAIRSDYDFVVAKNCAAFNYATLLIGNLASGSDYNATDLADSWTQGSNNLNSLTFADQFESTTNDFRVKAGADLIGAGIEDLTNYPEDISGFTRADPPTIGCWEFDAGGGGGGFQAAWAMGSNVVLSLGNP